MMDMEDFELCLKELKLLDVDANIDTKAADVPGFLIVTGVAVKWAHTSDPARLLIKLNGDGEISELILMRRKRPRKMTPEAFFQEIRSSAHDGDGLVVG